PSSNVSQSTFFVGYGPTASAMFANAMYQGAFTTDGSCPATMLAGAAPHSPGPLSGLWWNHNESGWGISVTQRRDTVFAAWYTYDGAGNPKWYFASNCVIPGGDNGTSGTCRGTVYETNGPALLGTDFDPSLVNASAAGSLQIEFKDASTASMSYSL